MGAGKLTTAGKAVIPTATVAAILVAVFGPKINGVSTETIASYVAVALGAITTVIHAPTARKTITKAKQLTKSKPRPARPFSMYDTIDIATVPPRPAAVAGYVGGHWPTYQPLVQRFPKAKHLSIAVNASQDAECLDVENGDATPAQAPDWCKRQHARGISRPCVYASVATMPAVLEALRAAGIARSMIRVWTAHYTGRPHLCNQSCWSTLRTVADATQYTDRALDRNLDESYCAGSFL